MRDRTSRGLIPGMERARRRRVLIDGSMAKSGGGFTYLVNLLPHLTAIAPDDRFRVLIRHEPLARSIPARANLEVELLPDVSWPQRLFFTYRRVARLAKEWRADLYFSAGESTPLRATFPMIASFRNPNVYTTMDQGWPWDQRLRMRVLRAASRVSSRRCDRIVFVSDDSARWIGDRLGIPQERRVVIPHGVDLAAWSRPPGPRTHRAVRRPYILSVSSIYRYKNFVRLIEAYGVLGRHREALPDLVIIGDVQDAMHSAEMQRARAATGDLAERIHLLGEVPYDEIPDYYYGAELFVFPSYLETFGHPLLEAMASGVPIVAADIPVFREIAGSAALYADPHDSRALARAMETALFAPGAREDLIGRGRERASGFGWDATAQRLSSLFDEVLSERAACGAPISGSSSSSELR